MSKLTRRNFNKAAAVASVSTALSAGRVLGANERIRLGFIGLGNRGDQVLDAFLEHKDCAGHGHLRHLSAVPRLRGQEDRRQSAAVSRLSPAARTQRRRCRGHLHAGPLARLADHPCLPGRQGRVRRKAAVAVRRRGPAHGRGGPARQTGHAGRPASPVVPLLPGGGRVHPQGRHRQGHGGAGLSHPERMAARHRQSRPTSSRPRTSTGKPGSARLRSGPTTRTAPSIASAGSTTIPAAS